jgi:thiamine monophosphate synthase
VLDGYTLADLVAPRRRLAQLLALPAVALDGCVPNARWVAGAGPGAIGELSVTGPALAVGAHGIAVRSAILGAPDAARAAQAFIRALPSS